MKKNLLAIIFASFCAGTLFAQNIAWPEEAVTGRSLVVYGECGRWLPDSLWINIQNGNGVRWI